MDVKRVIEGLDMPVAFSEFRIPREGEGLQARITTVLLNDITEAIEQAQRLCDPGRARRRQNDDAAEDRLRGGAHDPVRRG